MGDFLKEAMPKKPPPDELLQASLVRFEKMFQQAREFKVKIQSMIEGINQVGMTFFALSVDVNSFYDGWKYAPTEAIKTFTEVQSNFCVEVPKATLPIVSKERLKGMPELHTAFDHYKVKVSELQMDKAKAY